MIDFHSHILPGIDDGSGSVEESIALLDMLGAQGIDTVVATPHFQADRQSVGDFLTRRSAAYSALCSRMSDKHPAVRLGAEVEYYHGISRMSQLASLLIENSQLLLIEMPPRRWSDYTVKELIALAGSGSMTVALAHMERYMQYQSEDILHMLYDMGIRMQYNADFFLGFWTKRRAISLLKKGWIHMLGSDCHGVHHRSPQIGQAMDVIRGRLGEDFLRRLDAYERTLLK